MEDETSPLEKTRGENARRRLHEAPLSFPLEKCNARRRQNNASHQMNHKTTVSFVQSAISRLRKAGLRVHSRAPARS